MVEISRSYQVLCTQEYLLDNYPELTLDESEEIAYEVRRRMNQYDLDETYAIDEVLKEEGFINANNVDEYP